MPQEASFFRALAFESAKLTIALGDGDRTYGTVTFDHVRTFAFLKESDFWNDMKRSTVERIAWPTRDAAERFRHVGLFRVMQRPAIAPLIGDRFAEEEPSFFRLSTPDECVEVVAFADPLMNIEEPAKGRKGRTS